MGIAIPHHERRDFPAHEGSLKHYFKQRGWPGVSKWPAAGVNNDDGSTMTVYVNGDYGCVALWVDPLIPGVKRHRAMAMCPVCGEVMSAGRLQQHCARVHKGVA